MKHYYNPVSRAVWSDWMLKELEAPHEQIVVDIAAGDLGQWHVAFAEQLQEVRQRDEAIRDRYAVCEPPPSAGASAQGSLMVLHGRVHFTAAWHRADDARLRGKPLV